LTSGQRKAQFFALRIQIGVLTSSIHVPYCAKYIRIPPEAKARRRPYSNKDNKTVFCPYPDSFWMQVWMKIKKYMLKTKDRHNKTFKNLSDTYDTFFLKSNYGMKKPFCFSPCQNMTIHDYSLCSGDERSMTWEVIVEFAWS
jgi:hypothetical protein